MAEYLSSRVTPIPGTEKAQLLMVKRLPAPGGPHQNRKNKFEPTIRAEMEWRLFTQFRPMLRVISEARQSMIIGHSNKLDRDTSSLSAAYLKKWNVPSGDILELPGCPETGAEDMPAMLTIKEELQAQVSLEGEGGVISGRREESNKCCRTKRRPAAEVSIRRVRLEDWGSWLLLTACYLDSSLYFGGSISLHKFVTIHIAIIY